MRRVKWRWQPLHKNTGEKERSKSNNRLQSRWQYKLPTRKRGLENNRSTVTPQHYNKNVTQQYANNYLLGLVVQDPVSLTQG